jgi:hypothetical protein
MCPANLYGRAFVKFKLPKIGYKRGFSRSFLGLRN